MSGTESPSGLFGSNSDGGMRLWAWLDAMCLGCRHESARMRRDGDGGGCGCDIAASAVVDPDKAIPQWTTEAPKPGRLAELGDGPWPVCTSYEPRKTRSDKGIRRGPRDAGMEPLFEMEGAAN